MQAARQAKELTFSPGCDRASATGMWRAVLIMFVAMSFVPAGDLAGKILTGIYGAHPLFVAWSRFAIGALLVLPFVSGGVWVLLKDWRIWFRGTLLAGGVSCIQAALRTEPLADVFAAFFIAPILSFVLSVLFLRERATLLRALLVGLGFIGVLLVVRPGMGGSAALLWAVVAGVFYGAFLTTSRWLANQGSAIELSFTQMLIAALILLPLGMPQMPDMSLDVFGLTMASALGSMLGNLLLIVAYRMAPATILAPLVYFQLIAATALGWIVFADLPDPITWAGLAMILFAGLASAVSMRVSKAA